MEKRLEERGASHTDGKCVSELLGEGRPGGLEDNPQI